MKISFRKMELLSKKLQKEIKFAGLQIYPTKLYHYKLDGKDYECFTRKAKREEVRK